MSKTLKKRFEISADELNHRMELQQKYHDEPCVKAVQVLEAALDTVLITLGVDVTREPEIIQAQQDSLGITIYENDDVRTPQLNGFFVHIDYDKFTPYAWVGSVVLKSDGRAYCNIQWFKKDMLTQKGGVKVVG